VSTLKAIFDHHAKGPFMLLTEKDITAFPDIEACRERVDKLGGEQFAVVHVLWIGGADSQSNQMLTPDDETKGPRALTIAEQWCQAEEAEKQRRERARQKRESRLKEVGDRSANPTPLVDRSKEN
jgi:hypothetical protein